MTQYYHVTMDSKRDNAMIVKKLDGTMMRFVPAGKGLYAYTGTDISPSDAWALVNTVEDRKQEYTKREYRDAVLARKVQNIIMFLGVREYTKIADTKQPDCKLSHWTSGHHGCREDFWP
jgi:hypothetical protein